MNLEELNKEYVILKDKLAFYKDKLITENENLTRLKKENNNLKQELDKEKNQNDLQTQYKNNIKDIKKIKDHVSKIKDTIKELESSINIKMGELFADPELRIYLTEIIAESYDNSMLKFEQENDEYEAKKTKFETLKDLFINTPELYQSLLELKKAQQNINNLADEYKTLFYEDENNNWICKDKDRAQEIESEIETNKDTHFQKSKEIQDYFYNNKPMLNISIDDLNDFSKNVSLGDNDELDFSNIDIAIEEIEKKIEKNNEIIHNATTAIENDLVMPKNPKSKTLKSRLQKNQNQKNKSNSEQKNNSQNKTSTNQKSNFQHQTQTNKKTKHEYQQQSQNYTQQENKFEENKSEEQSNSKPKWYQFIQRFKNWRSNRIQKGLPSGNRNTEKTKNEQPVQTSQEARNAFRQQIQLDIVQDTLSKMEDAIYKKAEKQNKNKDIEK